MVAKYNILYNYLLKQQEELITDLKKKVVDILETKGRLLPSSKYMEHCINFTDGTIIIYSHRPDFCIGTIKIKTPSKGEFLEYSTDYISSEHNLEPLIKAADKLIEKYGR